MPGGDRISQRNDLDGLGDDETRAEDPAIRHARFVVTVTVMVLGALFIVILLVFFQPEGTPMIERWPNGYSKTETTYVKGVSETGRVAHGAHRAWHEDGTLAEEGTFADGLRTGDWHFWLETGELDAERSGHYEAGERTRGL